MTSSDLRQVLQVFTFVIIAVMLPVSGICSIDDVAGDKRIEIAMRVIGHEVLESLGDCDSRVMPIEKIDDHYRIPFEFEFAFDPDDMISIVRQVMSESGVASHYLVEVEQCETREIVHSFMVGDAAGAEMIPCRGRVLPQDCYSLLVTILDGSEMVTSSGGIEPQKSLPFKSALLFLPILLLIGGAVYVRFNKKSLDDIDPHVVTIGESHFDQRKMTLTHQNATVELSNKESELLALLHASLNKPVERDVILNRVWGDEGDYVGRTLDVFISRLRKKLEPDATVKIVNIRGVGYKLVIG